MSNDDKMEFTGVVESSCKGIFLVRVQSSDSSSHIVNCTLSGKIVQNGIRILSGDKVDVVSSVYDLSRGRIVFRHKQ